MGMFTDLNLAYQGLEGPLTRQWNAIKDKKLVEHKVEED